MNTGQKLVELSGLSGVSAIAHLLAITQGSGTGPGKTVFAAQVTICLETPQITLVQRKREYAIESQSAETMTAHGDRPNRINTLTRKSRIDVTTGNEAIYIVQKRANERMVRSARKTNATRHGPRVVVLTGIEAL